MQSTQKESAVVLHRQLSITLSPHHSSDDLLGPKASLSPSQNDRYSCVGAQSLSVGGFGWERHKHDNNLIEHLHLRAWMCENSSAVYLRQNV